MPSIASPAHAARSSKTSCSSTGVAARGGATKMFGSAAAPALVVLGLRDMVAPKRDDRASLAPKRRATHRNNTRSSCVDNPMADVQHSQHES